MKHTYFFEPLTWTASGDYYDEAGNCVPLRGETQVVRNGERWALTGFLEAAFEQPVRFTNDYSIDETEDASTLRWESYNPALGALKGTFEIIGNAIISYYISEDGAYSGTETLIQRSETAYYNAGVSFHLGKKMSSWTAELSARKESVR